MIAAGEALKALISQIKPQARLNLTFGRPLHLADTRVPGVGQQVTSTSSDAAGKQKIRNNAVVDVPGPELNICMNYNIHHSARTLSSGSMPTKRRSVSCQ
jgi:hypothetical protein